MMIWEICKPWVSVDADDERLQEVGNSKEKQYARFVRFLLLSNLIEPGTATRSLTVSLLLL